MPSIPEFHGHLPVRASYPPANIAKYGDAIAETWAQPWPMPPVWAQDFQDEDGGESLVYRGTFRIPLAEDHTRGNQKMHSAVTFDRLDSAYESPDGAIRAGQVCMSIDTSEAFDNIYGSVLVLDEAGLVELYRMLTMVLTNTCGYEVLPVSGVQIQSGKVAA